MAMRWMNEPKNKLNEKAKVSYPSLFGTIFEKDADKEMRRPEEAIDLCKSIEEGTDQDMRETAALNRSKNIRRQGRWIPEKSLKLRAAYFTTETTGYFQREVKAANPMNMMNNPDMMNNMLKQNIQSVLHMFMFTGIGSVFQGFITAQVPFPLGYKFKQML